MNLIHKIKHISLWIFLIPFVSINTCLILTQIFPYGEVFAIGDAISEDWRPWKIPYIDGSASISRVVRVFPNSFIFKPAMLVTAILLIVYWISVKNLIIKINQGHKNLKKIVLFGIISAVCLILHSIMLGIKFELNILKLLKRVVLLSFIIFEITAQAYLISVFFEIKSKIRPLINEKILIMKRILVSILIVSAIMIAPFLPFSNLKFFKHALEWNYLIGVISFYLLTFFMWKKNTN